MLLAANLGSTSQQRNIRHEPKRLFLRMTYSILSWLTLESRGSELMTAATISRRCVINCAKIGSVGVVRVC
jgi:hypothetical protein